MKITKRSPCDACHLSNEELSITMLSVAKTSSADAEGEPSKAPESKAKPWLGRNGDLKERWDIWNGWF